MSRRRSGSGGRDRLQLAPYPIEPQAQAIDAWRLADETMEVLLQPATWLFAFRSLETRGARVANTFYERPILNSPYEKPAFPHPLDDHGQPLGLPPVETRRPSKFIVPVPQARRRAARAQGAPPLATYSDSAIISEIRG